MSSNVFSLRFHDVRLRQLVQEVALREGVSQNELIEGAIRNEVVLRGELLADELAAAASRLQSMSDDLREELISRSIVEFGQGEANSDPIHAEQIPPHTFDQNLAKQTADPYGIVAAFRSRR